ncbi:MAG: zinc ribbon domain-containing protein [Dehalococcoidia bacterium]
MSAVLELVTLQSIDDDLAAARAQIADLTRRLEGDPELAEAKADLAGRDAAIAAQRKEQRRLEGEVEGFDAKIAQEEKRLYGGTVKNPKELQSLQHEVDLLKEHRGKVEDVLLPLLDLLETAAAERVAQAQRVTQLEARWHVQAAGMRDELAAREAAVATSETRRLAQVPKVSAPDYRLYEALRSRKGGAAVARLNGGSCAKCRIAVPEAIRRLAMTASTVIQCPNCERILTQG